MPNEDLLIALKTALRLEGSTIAEFARSLIKDNGEPISRGMVYHAARQRAPQWILDKITATVAKSRSTYPHYYRKKERQAAAE